MSHIARICLLIPIVFPVLSNAASYTFVTFDYPGATATVLSGINNAGQIVGSFFTATTYLQGFIRNADGSLVPIALPFPFTDSPASGINSSGQVVGASFYSGTFAVQGYLRSTVGTYSTIDDPVNPNNNGAFGINDGGMIVGSYADTSNPAFGHGFLRDTGGNFTTIDDPNMATNSNGNRYTNLSGLNTLGQIVGTYSDAAGSHGFLRSPAGVFTTIDDPNATPGTTSVRGVNNLGVIVGTFMDSSGYHSFLRSADGSSYTTIDYPKGTLTGNLGINDSGDIVGSYFSSLTGGQQHGFIATPTNSTVPESGILALPGWNRRDRLLPPPTTHLSPRIIATTGPAM